MPNTVAVVAKAIQTSKPASRAIEAKPIMVLIKAKPGTLTPSRMPISQSLLVVRSLDSGGDVSAISFKRSYYLNLG
jgi:hypothetical protein